MIRFVRTTRGIASASVTFVLLMVSGAAAHDSGTYAVIDVPQENVTAPQAINSNGIITGFWQDSSGVFRGFVRATDGTFTKFDPADTIDTEPHAINKKGWIVGQWTDSHSVQRGFIRAPNGHLMSVLLGTSTAITGIDQMGDTCGTFSDQNGTHGFLRTADGEVTQIDAPSGTGAFSSTGINDSRMIAGSPVGGGHYAFVRGADGTVTAFTIPNGVSVWADSINAAGTLVGRYFDTQLSRERGFTRDIQGKLTFFDPSNQTNPHMVRFVVDDKGTIAGSYDTSDYDFRYGFLRKANGNIVRLRPPEGDRNIEVNGINSHGDIVSTYSTVPDVTHGLLRLP